MTVADVMTRNVVTCRGEDSLVVPAQLMWDHDCGSVVIVDGEGKPIGMVTDRDICMAAYTTGNALGALCVAQAMSKSLHACHATDSIAAAEVLMRANQIRRVPVLDGGRIVGIVSLNDLAVAAADMPRRAKKGGLSAADVGATLAAICARRSTGAAAVASAA